MDVTLHAAKVTKSCCKVMSMQFGVSYIHKTNLESQLAPSLFLLSFISKTEMRGLPKSKK